MPEEKKVEGTEVSKKDGEVTPKEPEAEKKETPLEVVDGFVKVPADKYNSIKDDMHKYKGQRNDLREENEKLSKQVSDAKTEEDKKEEEKLLEDGKLKELAEKKTKDAEDAREDLKKEKIQNALKVKALQEGIVDIDGLALVNTSSISMDPETGVISGIDEAIETLKKDKEYLFQKPSDPKVDTGKAGKVPTDPITKKDMLYDAKLARQIKSEDPERYERIIKNGSG